MNVGHSFVIEFNAEGLHRAKEFEDTIRTAIKEHGGHVTHIDHEEERAVRLNEFDETVKKFYKFKNWIK